MFRLLKYIFAASLYKKAKKHFIWLFIFIVTLILFSFMMGDVLSVATGFSVYALLLVKWITIPTLLALILFRALRIVNIASNPFESVEKSEKISVVVDDKKEKILAKDRLYTQSDLIMQKYMKDK